MARIKGWTKKGLDSWEHRRKNQSGMKRAQVLQIKRIPVTSPWNYNAGMKWGAYSHQSGGWPTHEQATPSLVGSGKTKEEARQKAIRYMERYVKLYGA